MIDCVGKRVGDYHMAALINAGSSRKLYRAVCKSTENPNAAQNEVVAVELFPGECPDIADTLLSLDHPGIAKYLDIIRAEVDGEQVCGAVREFIGGRTTRTSLKEAPRGLPWKDVSSIMNQCLAAFMSARDSGIAHGPLRPEMLSVSESGEVKLTGFLPGKHAFEDDEGYVAPELIGEGTCPDEASDIYSLGVVFYELLTGKTPRKSTGVRSPGGRVRPSFSAGAFKILSGRCREVILRSVHEDKRKRFRTFEEMKDDLDALKPRVIKASVDYELEEYLGRGGFGEVYRARSLADGAAVAIKYLYSDQQPERFLREGRLLQKSNNPYVVRYIDFAEKEGIGGDIKYFLVMEYLKGMPGWGLKQRIRSSGDGLDVEETMELFSRYLEALHNLHENNVIHRDIKPANLYAPEGKPEEARIFDMGISKDISGTVTTGHVPGTLDYMPPEFALSSKERGTARSDIYSTGLSLYESLTGKTAYPKLPHADNKALMEFMDRATGRSKERVDYDLLPFRKCPKLVDIIKKSIAHEPKRRFKTAHDMKIAIDEVLGRLLDEKNAAMPAEPEKPAAVREPAPARKAPVKKPPKAEPEKVKQEPRREEPRRKPARERKPAGRVPREPAVHVRNERRVHAKPHVKKKMTSRERLVAEAKAEEGRSRSRSEGDRDSSLPVLILRTMVIMVGLLGAIVLIVWSVKEMPGRKARESMRVTCSSLDVPRASKQYMLDLKHAIGVADVWTYRDTSHQAEWVGWRGMLAEQAKEMPAEFQREFSLAVADRNKGRAHLLMQEWRGLKNSSESMGLNAGEHAAVMASMRRSAGLMNLTDEMTALENSIPVQLSLRSLLKAEDAAARYVALLDKADKVGGGDDIKARLNAVASRLSGVSRDYVRRLEETGSMWYSKDKAANGDRNYAELRSFADTCPLLSGMVKNNYLKAIRTLVEAK